MSTADALAVAAVALDNETNALRQELAQVLTYLQDAAKRSDAGDRAGAVAAVLDAIDAEFDAVGATIVSSNFAEMIGISNEVDAADERENAPRSHEFAAFDAALSDVMNGDEAVASTRLETHALGILEAEQADCVIVVAIGGPHGSRFSAKLRHDAATAETVANELRQISDAIREKL